MIGPQCAADYWPQLVQECSTEIAAMTAGDMESGGEVVECFDEVNTSRLDRNMLGSLF